MASDLEKLLPLLCKEYPDFDVIYDVPVSYIQTLSGQTNKIIFVCKKDPDAALKIDTNTTPLKLRRNESDIMNLTGSPLKDDFNVELLDVSLDTYLSKQNPWSSEEECYAGISVENARAILCDVNLQQQPTSAIGSLWVLCSTPNEECITLLERDFDKNFFIRGIVKHKGCIHSKQLNLREVMEEHKKLVGNLTKVTIHIDSMIYVQPNICLKVSVATGSSDILMNDYKNADIVLRQTFSKCNYSSLTCDFLETLKILTKIKDDIVGYKAGKFEDADDNISSFERERNFRELKKQISTIMSEVSGFWDTGTSIFEIQTALRHAQERSLIDITDKLWEALKGCRYSELKIGLQYVLQCAATCNIMNTPSNTNRLAELINGISQRRLVVPCLTGSEPLELLLEIGLEKVFKDYEFIFKEGKLCSSKELLATYESEIEQSMEINEQQIFHRNSDFQPIEAKDPQNSTFNSTIVEAKLLNLYKIHFALEHLIMLRRYLNFDTVHSTLCKQLLKRQMCPFNNLDDDLSDFIEMPIPVDKVVQHIESCVPNSRKVVLSSKNNFRHFQSTFFYSMDNIFPSIVAENPNMNDENLNEGIMYFVWSYIKIKTRHN